MTIQFPGLVQAHSNSISQLKNNTFHLIKLLLVINICYIFQVRTKDHTFENVPHLIKYHMKHGLPIISQESELHLIRPISNNYSNC
jgi:hypothetical protein